MLLGAYLELTRANLDCRTVETASEPIELLPDADADADAGAVALDLGELTAVPRTGVAAPARVRVHRRAWVSAAMRQELLWITVVYVAVHLGLLLAAYLQTSYSGHAFFNELANWDGKWYRELVNKGYPSYVSHGQTTLGFFPLYPLAIWPVEHLISPFLGTAPIWWSATIAGVVISSFGGLVATILVHRLAESWWDRETARRAAILFVLSPAPSCS